MSKWFITCCSAPADSRCDAGIAVEESEICIKSPEWDNHNRFKIGQMWIGNGEYWNQANFCPFCGKKAVVQLGK